jgi:hypothetical protein
VDSSCSGGLCVRALHTIFPLCIEVLTGIGLNNKKYARLQKWTQRKTDTIN